MLISDALHKWHTSHIGIKGDFLSLKERPTIWGHSTHVAQNENLNL
jgi:hypothetical protein